MNARSAARAARRWFTPIARSVRGIVASAHTWLVVAYASGGILVTHGTGALLGTPTAMLVAGAFCLFGARFIARGLANG